MNECGVLYLYIKQLSSRRVAHFVLNVICSKFHVLDSRIRTPGIEPGTAAWESVVLPLHHVRIIIIIKLHQKLNQTIIHAVKMSLNAFFIHISR